MNTIELALKQRQNTPAKNRARVAIRRVMSDKQLDGVRALHAETESVCRNGHLRTTENTGVYKDGRTRCKICDRERVTKNRERMKVEKEEGLR